MDTNQYQFADLTRRIIGCAMEVHNVIGRGFREVIYQRALALEMKDAGLSFHREFEMPIYYKGILIGKGRVDFLVEEKIALELKAVSSLEDAHLAQGKNSLEAYQLEVGLLINFGARSLEFKRLMNHRLPPTLNHEK